MIGTVPFDVSRMCPGTKINGTRTKLALKHPEWFPFRVEVDREAVCLCSGKQGGVKQHGSGPEWFDTGIARLSSRSDSRKAASAQIAKIPFPLASYIARAFRP